VVVVRVNSNPIFKPSTSQEKSVLKAPLEKPSNMRLDDGSIKKNIGTMGLLKLIIMDSKMLFVLSLSDAKIISSLGLKRLLIGQLSFILYLALLYDMGIIPLNILLIFCIVYLTLKSMTLNSFSLMSGNLKMRTLLILICSKYP